MSKKVAKKRSAADESTFEQSLAELEQIVDELESGDLGLGDALDAYEKGVKRLKQCQKLLETAERRIELLSGVDADGNAVANDFEEHASGDLTEQASARGRKRTSARSASARDVDDPTALF